MKQEEINSLAQSIIEDVHNYEFYFENPMQLHSACYATLITFDYNEAIILANLQKPILPDYLDQFIKVVKKDDKYSIDFKNGCELNLLMYCIDKAFRETQK
jgi:hypothetical protein